MTALLAPSDVALANSKVDMVFVCKLIGMRDVDYGSSGAKIDCPFGNVFHPDGQKSFRMYGQSAHCFACGETWRPVQLYSQARDVSLDDAAAQLLEAAGYTKPSPEERFAQAMADAQPVDQDALADALKTYCSRRYTDWEERQFDETISAKFRQCVELLPNVRNADQASQWMTVAKLAMTKVLGEPHDKAR